VRTKKKSHDSNKELLRLVEVAQLAGAGIPLTTGQAATYLQLSKGTLEVWRCLNKGPRFILVSTLPRYLKTDLDAYLASCTTRRKGSPNAGRKPKNRRAS
jgi:hypothetical protein